MYLPTEEAWYTFLESWWCTRLCPAPLVHVLGVGRDGGHRLFGGWDCSDGVIHMLSGVGNLVINMKQTVKLCRKRKGSTPVLIHSLSTAGHFFHPFMKNQKVYDFIAKVYQVNKQKWDECDITNQNIS